MFDHVGYNVSDFARSKAFYAAALKPLGHTILAEGDAWSMIGIEGGPRLWIGAFGPAASPIHVALRAETRAQVHEFHKAALDAGRRDNGPPGPRPSYGPAYYAAFVLDPDGHNIEAVCTA